jgi:hypothetical protein
MKELHVTFYRVWLLELKVNYETKNLRSRIFNSYLINATASELGSLLSELLCCNILSVNKWKLEILKITRTASLFAASLSFF